MSTSSESDARLVSGSSEIANYPQPRVYVYVKLSFSAAHSVLGEPLHGHNYKLCVGVTGELNNGIIVDFRELKAMIRQEILSELDHTYLNELISNPTAENIANYIWSKLNPILMRYHLKLVELKLWEDEDSWVELRA